MFHPQLEIFVLAVECGSFSSAAAARFCSPVAIMNQMNALEERLGIRLLERTSRGVLPTSAGAVFYEEAKDLIARAEAALGRAKKMAGAEDGRIRIGTSFLRPCKPLLSALATLEPVVQADFQISIIPFEDSPASLGGMLASLGNAIDCFVGPCDSEHWKKNFSVVPFARVRCCIALSKRHPLAEKKSLEWRDLEGERLMLIKRGISSVIDRMRCDLERRCPGAVIIDADTVYDAEAFNACEKEGYLMEIPEIWADVHPGLACLPVEWEHTLPYGVIFSKAPSASFRRFIKMVGCLLRKRAGAGSCLAELKSQKMSAF